MEINLKQSSINAPYIPDNNTGRQYVYFGANNNFPNEVLSLVASSPLQSVIIEKMVKYVIGLGLGDYNISEPNYMDTWDELLEKVVSDYIIFNAFAFQIVKKDETYYYYHQSVAEVRMQPTDDDNRIRGYYISKRWGKNNSIRTATYIKAFGVEEPIDGEPYLIYVKKYTPQEFYYAIPKYWPSANYIAADAAISRYYNNYTNNNFSANFAITYPIEVDEEKKGEIYEGLMQAFGGADNAGSILLLFGANGEKPEIQNISSTDADLYNTTSDLVTRSLITANEITSPSLFGISTASGFSSQADEMITAYTLYKNTVIMPIRNFILRKINTLIKLNGNTEQLELLDINIIEELEGVTNNNENKTEEATEV